MKEGETRGGNSLQQKKRFVYKRKEKQLNTTIKADIEWLLNSIDSGDTPELMTYVRPKIAWELR